MKLKSGGTLWMRWLIANGLGEMVGLGLTFAVGAIFISSMGNDQSLEVILVSFLVAVASGTIEATLVGLAQWWAMHPWFPGITRRAWWLATLVGALLAYVMGWMPSTLMSLSEQSAGSPNQLAEPAQWLVLLLAAGLGLAGGVVLSFAQWLVMRRTVKGAVVWLPANMLAWLVGMPIIFWGIDILQKVDGLAWQIAIMAGILLLAGLSVGVIHGSFLVRLARPVESYSSQQVV